LVRIEPITAGGRYEVKRMTVAPRAALELQRHEHQSQHWVIVRGVARVTRGAHIVELHENEAIFIPRQVSHRLENAGAGPLEVIEVRVGARA